MEFPQNLGNSLGIPSEFPWNSFGIALEFPWNSLGIPLIGNPIKAITWGDDYQLCFTISSSKSEKLAEISKKHKVKITNIGKLTKGKGVTVLLDGKKINIKKSGYNHFSE